MESMYLIQGWKKQGGGLGPPPNYPMTKNSILIRLFFIVHTPDKVLVDLKIVTDDTIVEVDRKSTRLNSSHIQKSRMPSSA